MVLQSSGPISIGDVAAEFGGAAPHSLSEYYGVAPGIPTSGIISLSDFYGASASTSIDVELTIEVLATYAGYVSTAYPPPPDPLGSISPEPLMLNGARVVYLLHNWYKDNMNLYVVMLGNLPYDQFSSITTPEAGTQYTVSNAYNSDNNTSIWGFSPGGDPPPWFEMDGQTVDVSFEE